MCVVVMKSVTLMTVWHSRLNRDWQLWLRWWRRCDVVDGGIRFYSNHKRLFYDRIKVSSQAPCLIRHSWMFLINFFFPSSWLSRCGVGVVFFTVSVLYTAGGKLGQQTQNISIFLFWFNISLRSSHHLTRNSFTTTIWTRACELGHSSSHIPVLNKNIVQETGDNSEIMTSSPSNEISQHVTALKAGSRRLVTWCSTTTRCTILIRKWLRFAQRRRSTEMCLWQHLR